MPTPPTKIIPFTGNRSLYTPYVKTSQILGTLTVYPAAFVKKGATRIYLASGIDMIGDAGPTDRVIKIGRYWYTFPELLENFDLISLATLQTSPAGYYMAPPAG